MKTVRQVLKRFASFSDRRLVAGLRDWPRLEVSSRITHHASHSAFSLIEMLVVIAIIGIIAAISVPALNNFRKADADAAATRQLADELANARQRAIKDRTDVFMVFMPPVANLGPTLTDAEVNSLLAAASPDLRPAISNALALQYVGYALYSERSVGDQPGQRTPRYLTEWRSLPQGVFIASNKFVVFDNGVFPFSYRFFPFPTADSPVSRPLPYVAFDYQGSLFTLDNNGNKVFGFDQVIPLARGSVVPRRAGPPWLAEAREEPPGNSVTISNHIRIDSLTGRARIERARF